MLEITSSTICKALHALHMQDWVFFTELRVGTGFTTNADQRIDAWAMHTLPSKKLERVAYEVKVSRQDFLNEIKNPQKRRHAILFSNRFYFVTTPGIVKRDELPAECGLMEYDGIRLKEVVSAPWRDPIGASWAVVASVLRRVEGTEVKALKEQIADLTKRNKLLESQNAVLRRSL